jgi:hypothetical protein
MSYADLPSLKTYLGNTESTDDGLLTELLARAAAAIDTHCRRSFAVDGDATRYYDAAGDHIRGNTLYIDDADLCSITTVTNGDGVEVGDGEYVTTPRNNAPYYAIKILASSGKYWAYTDDYEGAIAITGGWAYSVDPPEDIVHANIRYAAYMYFQKDSPVFDTTAIPDAGVITAPVGIPADVRKILQPYRRPL